MAKADVSRWALCGSGAREKGTVFGAGSAFLAGFAGSGPELRQRELDELRFHRVLDGHLRRRQGLAVRENAHAAGHAVPNLRGESEGH